jgi:hypothetical protein
LHVLITPEGPSFCNPLKQKEIAYISLRDSLVKFFSNNSLILGHMRRIDVYKNPSSVVDWNLPAYNILMGSIPESVADS